MYVAHACVELQALNTMGCTKVTNEGILQLAYRTRRYYTGRKGIATKGMYNHDDPMLTLAGIEVLGDVC